MLLHAEGLVRHYATPRGQLPAVDGVDLELSAGEIVAICGRSGSGKSTLLALLGGLSRPSAGRVFFDGHDLQTLGRSRLADLRARRLGFLFQFGGLLPNLRAIDNIALPALLVGLPQDEALARARTLLDEIGLPDRWDAYPAQLSGGQQRRVALARALVNRPALLLADEPTNDLDAQAEQEVLALLGSLPAAQGTAVLLVTHDAWVAALAQRVLQMQAGRIVSVATSAGALPPPPPPAPPPTLPAAIPTPPGAGLVRGAMTFVGWALLTALLLASIDALTARWQGGALAQQRESRRRAHDMALQQLRAEIADVQYLPEGAYQVQLFLDNLAPESPVFVLGPALRAFAQVDRGWTELPLRPVGFQERDVQEISARRTFTFHLRADLPRFDELLGGYLHLRFSNVMVLSPQPEPGDDLFQRSDDYYIYLRPQHLSEDEVRRRNRWKPTALVPRWISMPSH
ncbi:MAG: ABC transporter ATP-binding protein [Gemmataceae bacterium]